MLHAEFYLEGFKVIPAFDIQAVGLHVVHFATCSFISRGHLFYLQPEGASHR
jgi:Fe-S cluster assembly scaffold protein SufB